MNSQKIEKREVVITKLALLGGSYSEEKRNAFVCMNGPGMDRDLSDDGWISGHCRANRDIKDTITRDEIDWEATRAYQAKHGKLAPARPYRRKPETLSSLLSKATTDPEAQP